MATTRLRQSKKGHYYEIRAYSHGEEITTRWYIPTGSGGRPLSDKEIQKRLAKETSDFEKQVLSGEIIKKKEATKARKAQEAKRLEEEAKIKTLRQYSELVFMPDLSVTCAEHTRGSFQGMLQKHIYPILGECKLNEITPVQISALLLDTQRKGYKIATCVKLYTILNMIFKKAYLEDAIEKNPMDKVHRPKATKAEGKKTEVDAYSSKDVAYILSCLENETLLWKTFVYLLMNTGCRKGEALGLKWSDINILEKEITFSRTVGYTVQKGVFLDTPKNGKSRTVSISDKMIGYFCQLKEAQNAERKILPFMTGGLTGQFVFSTDGGADPLHPNTTTTYFKRLERKYGIAHFHPHKLRHSFASIAITNGADVASVSEVLGHSDKAVTLRMYTHADAESMRRASMIVENAIQGREA